MLPLAVLKMPSSFLISSADMVENAVLHPIGSPQSTGLRG
jgi:hypothetical protein